MGHDNNKSNWMYYRTVSALYAFGRFLSGGRAGRAGEGERRGAVFAIDSIGDHIIDLYFYQAVTKDSDAYDGWCAAGIYRAVRDPEWKKMVFCSEPDGLLVVLVVLIVLQTAMLGIGTHMDDDDAFYVATATTSVDTDTLYQIEPYTGNVYGNFPARYVLSPFPMLAAVISRCTGIRPAVVCHTVYPFFLIPLAYGVYALLAEKVFAGKKEEKKLFLIGVSLIQLYSGVSSLTVGKFLLIRIWQGKAILAAIILPYLLYFALEYGSQRYLKMREWWLLICVMMAGCFVSSMGIMLAAIEVGLLSILAVIKYKNVRLLLQAALSNVLNLLLAGIYLYIR